MGNPLTRRGWAQTAMAGSLAAAQTVKPEADAAEQLLEAARKQVARNHETLDKFPLKMAVEPSFQFKA